MTLQSKVVAQNRFFEILPCTSPSALKWLAGNCLWVYKFENWFWALQKTLKVPCVIIVAQTKFHLSSYSGSGFFHFSWEQQQSSLNELPSICTLAQLHHFSQSSEIFLAPFQYKIQSSKTFLHHLSTKYKKQLNFLHNFCQKDRFVKIFIDPKGALEITLHVKERWRWYTMHCNGEP